MRIRIIDLITGAVKVPCTIFRAVGQEMSGERSRNRRNNREEILLTREHFSNGSLFRESNISHGVLRVAEPESIKLKLFNGAEAVISYLSSGCTVPENK